MTESKNSRANAMQKLGVHEKGGVVTLDKESLMVSLGGWFGIIQSAIPSALFVLIYATTKNTIAATVSASLIAILFVAYQLIKRRPTQQAIAGVIGIAISAFLTLRDGGHPADYFVQGFFTNLAYGSVLAISILVRWPLVGFLVGLMRGEFLVWHKNRKILRRADLVTGIFVALFAGRLAVQVPLYFANEIELLGIARVAMGVPLYALCIWLSWLLLRSSIAQVK